MSTAISGKPVLFQCRWFVYEPAERDIPQYEGAPAVPRSVLAYERLASLRLSARHPDSIKNLANQFLTQEALARRVLPGEFLIRGSTVARQPAVAALRSILVLIWNGDRHASYAARHYNH